MTEAGVFQEVERLERDRHPVTHSPELLSSGSSTSRGRASGSTENLSRERSPWTRSMPCRAGTPPSLSSLRVRCQSSPSQTRRQSSRRSHGTRWDARSTSQSESRKKTFAGRGPLSACLIGEPLREIEEPGARRRKLSPPLLRQPVVAPSRPLLAKRLLGIFPARLEEFPFFLTRRGETQKK